jgi:hypothetical protein
MSLVANIRIEGGLDMDAFTKQIVWMSQKRVPIPMWLAALICERDEDDCVFGRFVGVDPNEFLAFRKLLQARYDKKPSDEAAGLMSLCDYLYDEIDKIVPWSAT